MTMPTTNSIALEMAGRRGQRARDRDATLITVLRSRIGGLAPVGTVLKPVSNMDFRFVYLVLGHYQDEYLGGDGLVLQVCHRVHGKLIRRPGEIFRDDIRAIRGGAYKCLRYKAENCFGIRIDPPYFVAVTWPGSQFDMFGAPPTCPISDKAAAARHTNAAVDQDSACDTPHWQHDHRATVQIDLNFIGGDTPGAN